MPISDDTYIADFTNWKAEAFYFYDNNGNIVEYITRHANNKIAQNKFSAESLIAVSEIGLVTNNVAALSEELALKFGVPNFHRQPQKETFAASGDDDGLFILTHNGRKWYPTNNEACNFPTRIVFLSKNVLYHLVL